ncbi:MAG: protein translocase subunit SecF [Bdellovibrionales bacterium]|nr:protein translocase subunit SecF [Bdellovibrionales bacterium]
MGKRHQQQSNPKASRKNDPGRFDFLKLGTAFAIISTILVLASLVLIATKGFNYGIDFAGGTEVQVQFNQAVEAGQVRSFTDEMGFNKASVQSFGEHNEYLIRLETVEGENDKETNELLKTLIAKLTEGLTNSFASQGATIRRVDSVGPQVGAELKRNGVLAAFYCLLLILVYIGLRFDYKYAPGAVFCLFHDSIVTLGIFSMFGREVNVQTMAAILTIIGYSLNDTIINFDRIRENEGLFRDEKFPWIVNRAVNDVLSRTILTSLTTMLAVAAMYFIGEGVIQDFAFTMGIGIIVGTYSSIYVANPLVIFMDGVLNKKATA